MKLVPGWTQLQKKNATVSRKLLQTVEWPNYTSQQFSRTSLVQQANAKELTIFSCPKNGYPNVNVVPLQSSAIFLVELVEHVHGQTKLGTVLLIFRPLSLPWAHYLLLPIAPPSSSPPPPPPRSCNDQNCLHIGRSKAKSKRQMFGSRNGKKCLEAALSSTVSFFFFIFLIQLPSYTCLNSENPTEIEWAEVVDNLPLSARKREKRK